MVHDIWVPLFCVLMLEQAGLVQRGNNSNDREPIELAWSTTECILEDATMLLGSDDSDNDYIGADEAKEQLESTPLEAESSDRSLAFPKGESLLMSEASMMPRSRGLKQECETDSAVDEHENAFVGQKARKIARKVNQVKSTPLGIGVVATYYNPCVAFPEWGRQCGFCGSAGHLFFKEQDMLAHPCAKKRVLADSATMAIFTVCSYSRCTMSFARCQGLPCFTSHLRPVRSTGSRWRLPNDQ